MSFRRNDRAGLRVNHPPFRKGDVVIVNEAPDKHGVVQVVSQPGDQHPSLIASNLLVKVND